MLCDDLEAWDMVYGVGCGQGGGREAREVEDICILMADSPFCAVETNTLL